MLSELSEDNLDTISDHLNLASALHLASVAKSILGLGDRLRRRADKSVQKIQRAFRRHYCWPLGLRAMVKTLNPTAVAFQSQRAKAAILARFEGLEHSETSERARAASMQMQTFVTILHEVSSLFKATRPGSQCALASALGLAQGSPPGTKPHTMRPA